MVLGQSSPSAKKKVYLISHVIAEEIENAIKKGFLGGDKTKKCLIIKLKYLLLMLLKRKIKMKVYLRKNKNNVENDGIKNIKRKSKRIKRGII